MLPEFVTFTVVYNNNLTIHLQDGREIGVKEGIKIYLNVWQRGHNKFKFHITQNGS